MINNILELLQMPPQPSPMQNPGMSLASVSRPYVDDLNTSPMDLNSMVAQLEGNSGPSVQMGNLGDPKTLSGRIQEWLGAKKPNQGGMAQDILTQRFQDPVMQGFEPNQDDTINAVTQTWADPFKAQTRQGAADARMAGTLDKLAALARIKSIGSGGSGSVFAQTMEAINNDPELAKLPMMTKIRMAQNKVGTNLTMGADGRVSDMTGAAEGLGNLSYGDKMGDQRAILDTARDIEAEKARGSMEGGPLPSTIVTTQDELIDAIQTHKMLEQKMGAFVNQIDSGQLNLNVLSNAENRLRNRLSLSDQESINLASFKAGLEALRNDSLRLNKGVQTEGDAIRAWNELVENLNDPRVVRQRLSDIAALNRNAAILKSDRLNTIRGEYGRDPVGDISVPNIKNTGGVVDFNDLPD